MKMNSRGANSIVLDDHNLSGLLFSVILMAIGLYVMVNQIGTGEIVGIAFGAAFFAGGAYLFGNARVIKIEINKSGNSLFLIGSLLERRHREVPTSRIKEIRLERFIDFMPNSYYTYLLVFVLDTKEEISVRYGDLEAEFDKFGFIKSGKQSGAKKLAEFIGVPFKYGGSMDLEDVAHAVGHGVGKLGKKKGLPPEA
ncbi:MAG: hypothetical protein GY852_04585 [bacterium]|nr:hypothetical protein [bacterium]